jgi:hypothetical protein
MNLRVRENPWRLMLAVNAAVLTGVFLYKIPREPYVPYIHLLVDYHFGFTKRALIGAVVSLFFAKVPVWLVFALSGAVWLITLGLFVQLFRRTFGLDDAHMPLFVFMAGSPFFLKNFMHTLGHFDIYGCAFAICLLLVPARSVVFVLLAALASMILILVHHIHLLMYVPTIAVIVVLRHYLVQGFNRQNAIAGIAAISCIGVLFFAAQFRGSLAVPEAEFVQYLQGRMAAHPDQSLELQLYLVSAAFLGDSRYLGSHAVESAGHSRLCAVDLAPRPALAILFQFDPVAYGRFASPPCHCRDRYGERGLSDHVCDRVRLFAMDFELGGLHVPDPACGKDIAQLKGSAADLDE